MDDTQLCSVASTSAVAQSTTTTSTLPRASKATKSVQGSSSSSSCHLSELPENLITAIFDNLNYKDVLRSHLINKRLRKILRRNSHYLCRPSVSEMRVKMGLIEKRYRPLGRLQPISSFQRCKSSRRLLSIAFGRQPNLPNANHNLRWKEFNEHEELIGDEHAMSSLFLDTLGDTLKQVNVDGTLSFYGIAIDSSLYERLTRSWVHISNAHDLVFTLCRFRLQTEQFRELLIRTNAHKLNLELSQFDEDILNDYVLEGLQDCHEFAASTTVPKYYRTLTDRTLNRWATQDSLPLRINFHNVCANFTLDGVLTLINALQVKHAELFSSVAEPTTSSSSSTHAHTSLKRYDWNFGCVRLVEDRSTILELMSLAGFVVCATNNDIVPNLLDISLNVKHPLSTSLLFPQYKYSSLMKITLQLATNQYKTN